MVSSSTWPDRAKNPSIPDVESTKKPPVNYWNAKVAAAAAAVTRTTGSQSTASDSSITADIDDDAFVVRVPPNRERNPLAIDDAEAWPEVGKSSAIKSNKEKDVEHSHQLGTGSKKNEKKWVPLPPDEWQLAPEHRPRIKNGPSQPTSTQSKNINGSNTRSRAQSGHNSVSQSTTQSRINSRSGSVHSSPRFPRNKRLPPDDGGISDSNPHPGNPPPIVLQPQPDMQAFPDNHLTESGHVPIAYPTPLYSPDNALTPYYARQPPFTSHQHFRHTSAHSSSNPNTPPLYQPPPPMPYPNATVPYPVYPQYVPYDYGMASPQSSFPYWNNPLHHSASGEPLQSYSNSGAHYSSHSPHPQPLRASQPGPINHYSDRPDDQSYAQQSSRVPLPPEQSQAVAAYVPIMLESDSSQMTFGSIAASESPRPPDEPADEKVVSKLEEVERAMTLFSIGMNENDTGSVRFRSRKRPVKASSRTSLTESPKGAEVKVIDLTDKETKWKFGFADGELSPPSRPGELLPPSAAGATTPGTQVSSSAVTPLSSISTSLPIDVALNNSLATSHPSGVPAPSDAGTDDSDAFKVKDYGWGFGTGKNPGPARPPRERRDRGERDHAEREGNDDGEGDGERSYNRQRRPYDRGGYGGRRGGRGGTNGYPRHNRGYRGGMQPHRPPHPASQIPLPGPHSPFPPPILPMAEHPDGYYPPNQVPPFIPQPYEAYPPPQFSPAPVPLSPIVSTPPMPPPRSELPYPLDTTRYWLLGQLEYYLSPQNLAQDFYLRQQMDAKGWIPIATLASFNRVKNLTHDYQTVKDVLVLSTVLMVKDDWVRMLGWESFVLPNAYASTVEQPDAPMTTQHVDRDEGPIETQPKADTEAEEEEEEEDVVFVMGKETGWSPQHRT